MVWGLLRLLLGRQVVLIWFAGDAFYLGFVIPKVWRPLFEASQDAFWGDVFGQCFGEGLSFAIHRMDGWVCG